jgi:hypothetical protein
VLIESVPDQRFNNGVAFQVRAWTPARPAQWTVQAFSVKVTGMGDVAPNAVGAAKTPSAYGSVGKFPIASGE